ncbi:MAG: guanylate kinase [Desulfovibrionaceae bacterium]
MIKRSGILFIICAPSGTGKTTIVQRLLNEFPNLYFSISYTTRSLREGEVDGKDYYFITEEEFAEKIQSGFFAEYANVHGKYYGTSREYIFEVLKKGYDLIFDIDVQGAKQLSKAFSEGICVFLLPPSKSVLESRLENRGTESKERIAERINNAKKEIEEVHWFDFCIVNTVLEEAYEDVRSVYISSMVSCKVNAVVVRDIIDSW